MIDLGQDRFNIETTEHTPNSTDRSAVQNKRTGARFSCSLTEHINSTLHSEGEIAIQASNAGTPSDNDPTPPISDNETDDEINRLFHNDAALQTTKLLDNRFSETAGLFLTADPELVTLSHFPHRLQPTGPQPSDPQDMSLGSLVKTSLVLSPSPASIPRIETPPVCEEPSFSATTNDTRKIVEATPLPQNGQPTAPQT